MKTIKSIGLITVWLFIMSFSIWFGAYVPSQIFSQAELQNVWSWIIGLLPLILGICIAIVVTCQAMMTLGEIWKKL